MNAERVTYTTKLAVLFIWGIILAGPLKYLSALSGVPVHLVFKLLLLISVVLQFAFFRVTPTQIAIAIGVGILAVAAHDRHFPTVQLAFGLWALIPLMFGLLFPRVVLSPYLRGHLGAIFAVALIGEAVSYFVVFPWSGMTMDVGGVATTAAREWASGSARRLAGFGTSSVDLSVELAAFGIFLMFNTTKFQTRFALLVVVSLALLGTTMKTAMVAFVLASLPLLAPIRALRIFTGFVALVAMALGIILPFTLKSDPLGIVELVRLHHFETLLARIDVTWPNVLGYLRYHDMGFWGIGLGGLGSAPPAAGDPFLYPYVDNFYLMLIGTSGFLGCVFLAFFARQVWKESFGVTTADRRFRLPMLTFFAVYGISQPLIEASVGALFMGAILSTGIEHRKRAATRASIFLRRPDAAAHSN